MKVSYDKTSEFVSDRLSYSARNVDSDNAHVVSLFIAIKDCSEPYKATLVKVYNNRTKSNGAPYSKARG